MYANPQTAGLRFKHYQYIRETKPVMTARLFNFILALFICSSCAAQQYQSLVDQSFIVHSGGNILVNTNSSSRNIVTIELPQKTKAFVYRITTGTAGNAAQPEKLYQLLKGLLPAQLAMEASLAQFLVNNTDSKSIDHFIFSNAYDANAFQQKRDGSWAYCKQNAGILSICQASQSCIGPVVYFGFRNNNFSNPVSVHLEIIAVVDTSATANSQYTYSIANGAPQPVNYLISNDQLNWEQLNLQQGYVHTLKKDRALIYIRLVTTANNIVTYEIHPEDRYKIVWNVSRWDLVKY